MFHPGSAKIFVSTCFLCRKFFCAALYTTRTGYRTLHGPAARMRDFTEHVWRSRLETFALLVRVLPAPRPALQRSALAGANPVVPVLNRRMPCLLIPRPKLFSSN